MSKSRPITVTDKNDKGWVVIDWTQVSDDAIQYDTNDEEEEEQAWLEAKRVEREQIEAEKAVWEAEERRVCEEEERQEAECKHKAKAGKSDEASTGGASGEAGGEVKRVVMDPGCTHCTWAQVICKFLVDGNKKRVACMHCNQSKGKCQWPGDRKDAEAGPKAVSSPGLLRPTPTLNKAAPKADKGKKRKADDEMPKPRPSKKKAKAIDKLLEVLDVDEGETSGSRPRGPSVAAFSGLEDKLKCLIDIAGLIANNLVGLFKAHKAVAENSGRITNALEVMLDESYGFRMAVSPLDSGSSELDSDELHKEADWLKAHSEDKEEESSREDETMAKAK
ncbi:hypothetical protein BKA82DRAFT_22512 [Pisolithus tinctorius]|uniref:Uncharacterized protein n=1 Tax=Pisolithus tinctorius Marx 270 TaxID=870435 RepID=A0A0C3KGE2_PISTI|nr:hypothetical protein BKA82DRAFT_22512 [Pisolithus tinctorius]KIO08662.1 hypothetical protein M404DRAFT_22512 [Pisolithus tinctorius Marx 270]